MRRILSGLTTRREGDAATRRHARKSPYLRVSASPRLRVPFSTPRRGAVLIGVMVCLLLVSMLLGSLLRLAVTQRRQVRTEQDLLQAQWLAESAMERAASRLAADAGYSGESWNIAADEFGGRHSGLVKISVRKQDDPPNERLVTIEATYPSGAVRFAKRTKQVTVEVNREP